MSLSSSKTKTTTDQNTTQSGTTMPIAPDWLTEGARDYVSRIGAFGDMDPNQFIAGASPLQQQAWGNASRLGDWQGQARTGAGLALGTALQGANTAGKYNPTMGPQIAQGPAAGKLNPMAGPQIAQGASGPMGAKGPPRATETTDFLPANQQPGIVPANGYSPAPEIPGYGQPRPGQPIGYQPPPGVAPNPAITGASQAAAYENPYQQQVIDTSLAGFDRNTGQQQAAMAAEAARNGAFGGSRYGIAEGQFNADSGLNRAGLEAGLRSQGFNTANQFGMQDAAAGNNMLQFDAQQRDNAMNRQLAAAGLLQQGADSYGAGQRADIGMMAGLGDQQRGIEQAYAGAPLAQLEMMGNLMGATPYQILTGQQVDSTGTMKGTNVTSQTPSLFNQLLGLGSLGVSAATGGLFGKI